MYQTTRACLLCTSTLVMSWYCQATWHALALSSSQARDHNIYYATSIMLTSLINGYTCTYSKLHHNSPLNASTVQQSHLRAHIRFNAYQCPSPKKHFIFLLPGFFSKKINVKKYKEPQNLEKILESGTQVSSKIILWTQSLIKNQREDYGRIILSIMC